MTEHVLPSSSPLSAPREENTTNYSLINVIDCKQEAVRAVRFTVDGAYCVTCGSGRRLKLWNPYNRVLLKTYQGHGDQVMDACVSCDNARIISCSYDKYVVLWDVATGAPIRWLAGHAGPVTCVRLNEGSTMAISGGRDNWVMCWDVRSNNKSAVEILNHAKDAISSVRVSDHEILAASFDGFVRNYDIRAGNLSSDRIAEVVTCASFSQDGRCILASCSDSGVVKLLDKQTGELLAEYKGHVADDLCLESSLDEDDARVISGSGDGAPRVWDLATRRLIGQLVCKTGVPAPSMSIDPREGHIAIACGEHIYLWKKHS